MPATTNTYDGPGNLASVTDQAGNTVQYVYDAANQLQRVVQLAHPNPANNTNSYGYDPLGNLAALTDENGHVTQNGYDLLSQPVTKLLPDGSLTESRNYDAAGNLTALRHFNGKTTTYTYDPLNRLIARVPDPSLGEPTVTFTYSATGKRASMTDGTGTTTYTYDTLDRLATKATPEGTLTYSYDAAGNVASMASSNANGASASYSYDALNRLTSVVDNRLPSGTNTTTYTYDNANNLVTATYPNGVTSTFQYDALNRVTSLSSPVASYNYQFSPTGNRTSATEQSGRTLKWSYDAINRLTIESVAQDPGGKDGSMNYGLDPVGNRLTETSSFLPISSDTFNFNADDWQETETYDSNGNVLNTGGKSFTYNSENQLVSEVGAVGLQYDGDGNRVSETVSGVTTRYLVDDLNPTGYAQVVEELSGGAVQREYTYGLQRICEDQLINKVWTPSFYNYDGGGTVRQLTSLAGSVTDTYAYDAFGNLLASIGATPNNYLYRGEQYDPSLGLYYLRARHYNPTTGRFMGRDAADGDSETPASFHKYAYAEADPTDRLDPNGRSATLTEPAQSESTGRSASEYATLVIKVTIASIPPVALVGCAVSTAYYYMAARTRTDTKITLQKGCRVKGQGSMLIQLQTGAAGRGDDKTVKQASRPLNNDDPPGVTYMQVHGALESIREAAPRGFPGFKKKLNNDLSRALDEVDECAMRIVAGGGVIGYTLWVCQGEVGNSGWRVDLDQLAGHNLRQ